MIGCALKGLVIGVVNCLLGSLRNQLGRRFGILSEAKSVAIQNSLPKRNHVAKEAVSTAWQTNTRQRSEQTGKPNDAPRTKQWPCVKTMLSNRGLPFEVDQIFSLPSRPQLRMNRHLQIAGVSIAKVDPLANQRLVASGHGQCSKLNARGVPTNACAGSVDWTKQFEHCFAFIIGVLRVKEGTHVIVGRDAPRLQQRPLLNRRVQGGR